ncbi:bifunctional 3-phosphoshikimate 1-carboxyvinyltransferase/cytidylate kinase [Azospira restricta]|uniref:Multifunctional fusion protein n=1 Tax=Azospira restricta TaxID=404405 RepID=A0A974PV74_9RHOO|nr:bifunctional 3-phosphoshikimate 1-carboxyvinyltransferase/cytidylate kinase [Azospira restricta]QRJ62144.1 bifunctional 3-phosphoshikimate 1-carboxyvinyltransferase/cytidylate kinase [Azospira restricta]
MEFLDLPPLLSARGTVRLPGSKSISNRVLLLSALADGETEVRDLLASDDTHVMLEALKQLGVGIRHEAGGVVRVAGVGGLFPVKSGDIFLGNAGTAVRSLTAALALAGGQYKVSGVPRMHERPIGDLVDGLRQLGADIAYLGNEGFPPLQLKPAQIKPGGVVKVRGDVSSQFLTGLLMALPLTGVETTVEVVGELISKPYIEITLATMARFGVNVVRDGWQRFVVPAGSRYRSPGTIYVEGDASSASYFLALGAIGGGPVRVEGVGRDSIQGDVRFADALARMGAVIEMGDNWIEAKAPAGGLTGITLDCNHIPDAAMTLATTALFAAGPTMLTNIASWRVKETDRIAAMAKELRKLGAEVEEGADYIRVTPAKALSSPPEGIDTYDDHRVAMCFSLAAFGTALRINDPKCVAKTFPDYFERLATVTEAVPVIAIDGPSASGKGTVAACVAAALGWHYLDSGALYRLTALAARRAGVAWDDESGVAAVAARLDVVFDGESIRLAGEEVGEAIRTEEMSSGASKVAALPAVRAALLFRQRLFRRAPGLVGDGRDMGSVVFPDAKTKVFLTASVEIRAERRYKQLIGKGIEATIQPILQDLRERDERDSQRSVAPLRQSDDAELLDTSALTIDEAVAKVLAWAAS